MGRPPVLTSPNPLSTLLQRFACARLSRPCLPESRPGVSATLTTTLLTVAACGGLRSAPDCRTRRALLHLSYSCAPPILTSALVTHDPKRSKSGLKSRIAAVSCRIEVCYLWSKPLEAPMAQLTMSFDCFGN